MITTLKMPNPIQSSQPSLAASKGFDPRLVLWVVVAVTYSPQTAEDAEVFGVPIPGAVEGILTGSACLLFCVHFIGRALRCKWLYQASFPSGKHRFAFG